MKYKGRYLDSKIDKYSVCDVGICNSCRDHINRLDYEMGRPDVFTDAQNIRLAKQYCPWEEICSVTRVLNELLDRSFTVLDSSPTYKELNRKAIKDSELVLDDQSTTLEERHGKFIILEHLPGGKVHVKCDCGNEETRYKSNVRISKYGCKHCTHRDFNKRSGIRPVIHGNNKHEITPK